MMHEFQKNFKSKKPHQFIEAFCELHDIPSHISSMKGSSLKAWHEL